MKKTLIIPDSHVTAHESLTRFEKCGKLLVDRGVDNVVVLGDFVSFDSLSHFDMSKRAKMEQRRYELDVQAGLEALSLLLKPLNASNERARINKQKQYKPRLVFCEGNHEYRVPRYLEVNAELIGFLDVETDLMLKEFGFEFCPYRDYIEVDGVTYTHSPMNKGNQPIGGKYAVARALERFNGHVIFGHTHRWEQMAEKRIDSETCNIALSAGCFFEETPEYAQGANNNWWKGLTIATIFDDDTLEFEQISSTRLNYEYD